MPHNSITSRVSLRLITLALHEMTLILLEKFERYISKKSRMHTRQLNTICWALKYEKIGSDWYMTLFNAMTSIKQLQFQTINDSDSY
jgi:hypothetical protein